LEYANEEQGTLSRHLTRFAEQVSNIQDYRQAEVGIFFYFFSIKNP